MILSAILAACQDFDGQNPDRIRIFKRVSHSICPEILGKCTVVRISRPEGTEIMSGQNFSLNKTGTLAEHQPAALGLPACLCCTGVVCHSVPSTWSSTQVVPCAPPQGSLQNGTTQYLPACMEDRLESLFARELRPLLFVNYGNINIVSSMGAWIRRYVLAWLTGSHLMFACMGLN